MKDDKLLQHDPLSEADLILRDDFYGRAAEPAPRASKARPTHYKVICISMYTDDLKRLDDMVDTLKAKGLTKANRSALIRFALNGVDLENVPKGL